MNVYIASDHAAIKEKNILAAFLTYNYPVVDCGPFDSKSCDYPDYAKIIAGKIKQDTDSFGVLLCGTGIGMSIACNFQGVPAARCCSVGDAIMARQHNHARVICLGARQLDVSRIIDIVETFVKTKPDFDERHVRRVSKAIGRVA